MALYKKSPLAAPAFLIPSSHQPSTSHIYIHTNTRPLPAICSSFQKINRFVGLSLSPLRVIKILSFTTRTTARREHPRQNGRARVFNMCFRHLIRARSLRALALLLLLVTCSGKGACAPSVTCDTHGEESGAGLGRA